MISSLHNSLYIMSFLFCNNTSNLHTRKVCCVLNYDVIAGKNKGLDDVNDPKHRGKSFER